MQGPPTDSPQRMLFYNDSTEMSSVLPVWRTHTTGTCCCFRNQLSETGANAMATQLKMNH